MGSVRGERTQLKWLPTWRAGWTLDFSAHAPVPGVVAEYAQILRVKQNKNGCTYLDGYSITPALTEDGLGAVIRAAPGSLWLVGNEPDRGPDPGQCQYGAQDDTFPEVYAHAYHDTYAFIKQRDPTARVAIAGLVQVTPGRLQYLDKVWAEYVRKYGGPMPVDVWNMHLYILSEAQPNGQPNGIANIALGTDASLAKRESGGDPKLCADPMVYCFAEHDNMAIFDQQIRAMRSWMKNHGQQNKPLILSEYSILWPYVIDPGGGCYLQDENGNCFTPQRANQFMTNTFNYFETATDPALGYPLDGNRLVQRWMWFSAYMDRGAPISNLLTSSLDALTPVGQHFQTEVNSRPGDVNLLPGAAAGIPARISAPGDTATVTLYAEVFNNGGLAVTAPVVVTFYADSALTQPIGSATINSGVAGCASRATRVSTTWAGRPQGTHSFWVKVDASNSVSENNENDNVATGTVAVYRYGNFLPIVTRW